MTVDEELTILEESLRRLKIEYDVFFGGGSKKPPADTEWRVQNLLKKYSDGHKMNFAQRFRFNTIQQRYALYSDLWRQKSKIKEEGYRRPQDALLAISGMRIEEEQAAKRALSEEKQAFRTDFSDVEAEHAQVKELFDAMMEAKRKAGDTGAANFDSFRAFVKKKTEQIRGEYGCHSVEYSVEMEGGQVKLKAKAKI